MVVLTVISLGGLALAVTGYAYARLKGLIVTKDPKPGPLIGESDRDKRRRRAAKLFNERLKLIATFLNTLGIAGFIAIIVAPYASGSRATALPSIGIGFISLFVIHAVAHFVLSAWKSEE